MTSKLAALLALATGCTSEDPRVAPVYEGPVDDPDATAAGIDELELAVAHAEDEADLVSASFSPGESVELGGLPFADDLVVHLGGRIGSSDVAYGRTCSFALTDGDEPPTPHLFFARAVKFASTGLTSRARAGAGAAAFADGSALITTGGGAERFDPRTGVLAPLAVTSPLAMRPRGLAAAYGLGAGQQIALVGVAPSAELIGIDGRVDRIEDLRLARTDATATTLTDGRVIVVGGVLGGGPAADVLELADTGRGPELRARAALAHPRSGHTATRLGDDVGAPVLVVGGVDASGTPVAEVELYRPLSGTFAAAPTFSPRLVTARSRHRAALMPDGSVLVIGGVDANGQPVLALERFTIDGGFAPAGLLPSPAGVVDATATTLPDGRILIAGGAATVGGAPVDTAFIARLDVVDGTVDVVATDRLARARSGHAAVRLCDGSILVIGGTGDDAVVERYNPPAVGRR